MKAITLTPVVVMLVSVFSWTAFACTVGAFHENAMADDRPMSWKNGDTGQLHWGLVKAFENTPSEVLIVDGNTSGYRWNNLAYHALNKHGFGVGDHSLFGMPNPPYMRNVTEGGKVGYCLATDSQTVDEALQDISDELADVEDFIWNEEQVCAAYAMHDAHGNAKLIELVHDSVNNIDESYVYDASTRPGYGYMVIRGGRMAHQNTDNTDDPPYNTREADGMNNFENAASSGGIDIFECMENARHGDPGAGGFTTCNNTTWVSDFRFGVKPTDNPKYATMFVSLGNPDYCIYIPAWVALTIDQISPYADGYDNGSDDIAYFTRQLYLSMGSGGPDELSDDNYINDLFANVQENIADAVVETRTKWFASGDQSDFNNTIYYLHRWSANAAYHTIRSAYSSLGGGRSCNIPPEFTSFSVTSPHSGEIIIAFDPDEALERYNIHWGDGTTSGWIDAGGSSGQQTRSRSGMPNGTYHIAVLIEDDHTYKARNVMFKWITVGDVLPPSQPTGLHIVN